MTNNLISLALLVFFLTTGYSYSEEQFLFPKKKPSVFKKIEKSVSSVNLKELPQRKPIIKLEDKKDISIKIENKDRNKIEIKKKRICINCRCQRY